MTLFRLESSLHEDNNHWTHLLSKSYRPIKTVTFLHYPIFRIDLVDLQPIRQHRPCGGTGSADGNVKLWGSRGDERYHKRKESPAIQRVIGWIGWIGIDMDHFDNDAETANINIDDLSQYLDKIPMSST